MKCRGVTPEGDTHCCKTEGGAPTQPYMTVAHSRNHTCTHTHTGSLSHTYTHAPFFIWVHQSSFLKSFTKLNKKNKKKENKEFSPLLFYIHLRLHTLIHTQAHTHIHKWVHTLSHKRQSVNVKWWVEGWTALSREAVTPPAGLALAPTRESLSAG